jgi:hypothetical protein
MDFIDEKIEKDLKPKLEGGLFVEISMSDIFGDSFHFRKDWYTVIDGIVYEVGDGRKYSTGDTLFNVYSDCKRVGKYNEKIIHKTLTKTYKYSELKKLIGF